jgi:hypothetical protein
MDLLKVIKEVPDPNNEPYPGAYYDRLEQLAYEAGWYSPRASFGMRGFDPLTFRNT